MRNTLQHGLKRNGRGRFNRSRLPDPITYFERLAFRFWGRGKWISTLCPFHDDSRPSLRVNSESGAWRCMVCAEAGGDVLEFQRRYFGHSFREAAMALDCWEAE